MALINGNSNADILDGTIDQDTINGGAGYDLITPGAGNDRIDGGDGVDILALTGTLGNYHVVEDIAAPGTYHISDLRAGAPEGSDTFTGIEKLRFEIGGEVSLADALDRPPTDLVLSFVPASGPEVSETASARAFVAVLSGVDPDPGETFTYELLDASGQAADAGDANGPRFKIEGDLLVAARANAFDFEENATHTVTVRVTDGAGNRFHKQVTVAVRDDVTPFTTVSAILPGDATEVGLWELDDGGFVITWRVTSGGQDTWFARRVDDSGATFDPAIPDRALLTLASPPPNAPVIQRLVGVDDEGVAAIVVDAGGFGLPDTIRWIDALTGAQVGTRTELQNHSGNSLRHVDGYQFDDGYVRYTVHERTDSASSSGGGYGSTSDSRTDSTLTSEQVTAVFVPTPGSSADTIDFTLLPTTASSILSSSSSFVSPVDHSGQFVRNDNFSGSVAESIDINEAGLVSYVRHDTTGTATERGAQSVVGGLPSFSGSTSSVGTTDETIIASGSSLGVVASTGRSAHASFTSTTSGSSQTNVDVPERGTGLGDIAVLDPGRFAYITFGIGSGSAAPELVFRNGTQTTAIPTTPFSSIEPLGADKYLLTGITSRIDPVTGITTFDHQAQAFDAFGNAISDVVVVSSGSFQSPFVIRDDGSFVAFTFQAATDPQQPGVPVVALDGQSILRSAVSVDADGGVFADTDGDGDLDFSGTILVGTGAVRSLRLETGSYELTDATLTVTNATVFADVGSDTTSPLFKGSFTLDRATGIASNFVMGQLGAGVDPFTIAGLTVVYRGLTVQNDGAAFKASFQLPTLFGADGPRLDLNSPNALLINATGPELEGFEFPIGTFDMDWFGLFEAEGKNIKVRYDGAQNELAFSGELEVTSDIVDGLAGLAGGAGVALTFKDLKIKDGKIDFEGELSAEKWSLGPIKLTDVKLGIKIDDNVVIKAEVAAGIALPFAQLEGLSFAAEVLNPPLTLNKIGLTAETAIPLPYGFFLDKIGGTLDHLAGSPPEPTPVPTSFTGLLGIGWGPKIPGFELPDFLGIDAIEAARIVNIELTATTDFSTSIAGAGKINLYQDELGKHTGSITWDWQHDTVTFTGGIDYLSGIITGTGTARFSELGFTVSGTGAVALPTASLFGPASGLQLVSASLLAQALADDNPANDELAAWGTVNLPGFGSLPVGVKVNLKNGLVSPILGMDDVPETNSFDVAAGEDWLMISAAWDNLVAGPVLTQVRTPENTFLQETDYAANGITIIDLFTGPTKKTIVIDNPRAGNWDLQVVDPSGLTNLDYSGFTPNQAVDITVGDVGLALGATTGQVAVSLVGADPGTDVIFFADTDGAGLDGYALGATTRDADGAFIFDFGTLPLDAGLCHIYAVADDGLNAPDFGYGGTFTVAHLPTDITLAPATAPVAAGAAALIAETALPGTEIAALGATNPDLNETHTFSLVGDAGGRFAIVGDKLVVGTGAPFDTLTATQHDIIVRATTSQGLAFEETVTIEIGVADGAPVVFSGTAERDALLGTDRRDVFFGASGEDTVIGRGEADVLYLDGNRSDFAIVLDATGAITGPVRAFTVPPGFDSANLLPNPFDPAPPYVLLDDLRDSAGPIVTSGIEILQFLDTRIILAQELNAAPVALADGPYATPEDTALAITAANGVLANDTDVETPPSSLTASIVSGPSHALDFTLNADGSFSYTPDADYFGPDSFTYKVNDGTEDSNIATVNLTVTALNDAPTLANAIADQTATEDTPFSFILAANTFADVDVGGSLTLAATLANGNPLPSWLAFNAGTGAFTGTPLNADVGPITVRVTATDGSLTSVYDDFTIAVANTNDAPTLANAIADQAATEDTPFSFILAANTFADVDVGGSLTLTATLANANPLPGWLAFNAGTGAFTGTPLNADVGPITVRVTATDGSLTSVYDDFTLTVANTNDAPTVANASTDQTATEDTPFSFTLAANTFADVDVGDSLTLTATLASGSPLPSWLAFNAGTGAFTGTPLNADVGPITVRVTATDGSPASVHDDFTIAVANTNDAPTANPDTGSAGENETKSFNVLANDADADAGDNKTLVSIGTVSVSSGNASVNGINAAIALSIVGAQIQLIPGTLFDPLNAGEAATVVVNYTMRDAAGVTSSSALTLTINGAAEGPVFNVINGTPGNDRNLNGTAAADQINGLAGNDAIDARGGDDLIIAGAGRDSVSAGSGNDTMVATINDGNDLYSGESGSDTLDFSQTSAPATVSLGTTVFGITFDGIGHATGQQIGTDILLSIENAIGGSGNDAITGDNLANALRGGAGNDTISGLRGDDNLAGDAGNDRLIGGRGSDLMSGGLDADTFLFQAAQSRAGDIDTITGFVVGQDHLQFQGLSVTQLAQRDVNGDSVLDTALTLNDEAVVRLLGVSGVSDWHALL